MWRWCQGCGDAAVYGDGCGEAWGMPQWGGGSILGDREYCRRCIDLQHVFFEDVAEAFEVVEACGAEMVRHADFDLVG